jgi:hypothetical protein
MEPAPQWLALLGAMPFLPRAVNGVMGLLS